MICCEAKDTLISVVTITYNAVDTIEDTILSVISQTYSELEYIIIDGGSNDGTVDIIKKYEDKVTFWSSELDKGIFDAMNKGLNKVSGDWINFMNSGDRFYSNHVLSDIFKGNIDVSFDVIYGDTNYSDKLGSYILSPNKLSEFDKHKGRYSWGMPFCHQSCFVKTSIMKFHLFDLRFTITADINLFYTLYRENKKFIYIPMPIAIYQVEGSTSLAHPILLYKEKLRILSIDRYTISVLNNFLRIYLVKILSFFIPNKYILKRKRYRLKKCINKI